MKLTRKSLKKGQRDPVSPVADAEDLYRRYLRIRAERGYFREHNGRG
ncbi:MAG: hypothetical protein WC294_08860 [Methanoregula sp.]